MQTIYQHQKEEERLNIEIKQLESDKEGLDKQLESEKNVLSTKERELNKLEDTLNREQQRYEEAQERHNGPALAASLGSLGVGGC